MNLSADLKRHISALTAKAQGASLMKFGEIRNIGCVQIICQSELLFRQPRAWAMKGRGWTLTYSIKAGEAVVSAAFYGDDDNATERFQEDVILVLMSL